MEQNSLKKSFYIFLAAVLGVLLFVTIQRSLALVGIILLNMDYAQYSLGTNYMQVHALNIATMMLAVLFGGWYGVWIGLHWYHLVYEQGRTGWLHGLNGGLFHRSSSVSSNKPVTKVVRRVAAQAKPKSHTRSVDIDGVGESSGGWEFDDLLSRRQVRVSSRTEQAEVSVEKPKRKAATVKKSRTRVKKTKSDTQNDIG